MISRFWVREAFPFQSKKKIHLYFLRVDSFVFTVYIFDPFEFILVYNMRYRFKFIFSTCYLFIKNSFYTTDLRWPMYLGLFLDFLFSSISISIPMAYAKIFHYWGLLVFFNIYWKIFFLFKRVYLLTYFFPFQKSLLAYLFFSFSKEFTCLLIFFSFQKSLLAYLFFSFSKEFTCLLIFPYEL